MANVSEEGHDDEEESASENVLKVNILINVTGKTVTFCMVSLFLRNMFDYSRQFYFYTASYLLNLPLNSPVILITLFGPLHLTSNLIYFFFGNFLAIASGETMIDIIWSDRWPIESNEPKVNVLDVCERNNKCMAFSFSLFLFSLWRTEYLWNSQKWSKNTVHSWRINKFHRKSETVWTGYQLRKTTGT